MCHTDTRHFQPAAQLCIIGTRELCPVEGHKTHPAGGELGSGVEGHNVGTGWFGPPEGLDHRGGTHEGVVGQAGQVATQNRAPMADLVEQTATIIQTWWQLKDRTGQRVIIECLYRRIDT